MIAVRHSVQIKRSTPFVFAALRDIRNWSMWASNGVRMGLVSTGLNKVGMQVRQMTHAGRKPPVHWIEVTDWIPAWVIQYNQSTLLGEFVLVPLETGTSLTARLEVDVDGFKGMLYRLFLTQWIKQDLHRFKDWIETCDR